MGVILESPVESLAARGGWVALRLSVASVAAMFVFPFLWPLHTQPLVSFYNEWIAAVLLIAACFMVSLNRASATARYFELPALTPVFMSLMVVVLLQWGLGQLTHSSDAVLPLMTLALATAAIVLGRVLAREGGLPRLLFWISVAGILGGLLNVAIQLMQLAVANGVWLTHLNIHNGGDFYGALAQRNHLASYLSWGVIGCLYLVAAGRFRARLLLPLLLILLVGMALTTSRTGFLQLIGIALVAVWLMWRVESESRPRHWYWVLALPAVYVVISLALPLVLDQADLTFRGSAVERAATEGLDGGRRLLYGQGLQIFLDHPLLGIGPGQLFFNQFELLDQVDKTLFASSTHNLVLDLLVMTGVVGTLPFLLLGGLWLYRTLNQTMSLERAAVLLLLSAFVLHSMLELPHWYGFFLLPVALLAGAIDEGSVRLPRGKLLRMLPVILCLYGSVVAASMWGQYRALERMFSTYHTKDRNPVAADERRLTELFEFQNTTWFTGATEYLIFTNIALNDIALKEKLDIASRAIRVLPDPHVVYRYVLLLALDGRQEEGLVAMERMRKMFPKAYEEIAIEFIKLAQQQPATFGRLAGSMKILSQD